MDNQILEVLEKQQTWKDENPDFQIVEKKILPQYFRDVSNGRKGFELRKDEDKIKAGDILLLREHSWNGYTGNCKAIRVKYVLRDVEKFGLKEGYCIIGF